MKTQTENKSTQRGAGTPQLPTHDELRQQGAKLVVDHINHREFVLNGTRYFCGWSSERDNNYSGPKTWSDPEYKVRGWLTYKTEAAQ